MGQFSLASTSELSSSSPPATLSNLSSSRRGCILLDQNGEPIDTRSADDLHHVRVMTTCDNNDDLDSNSDSDSAILDRNANLAIPGHQYHPNRSNGHHRYENEQGPVLPPQQEQHAQQRQTPPPPPRQQDAFDHQEHGSGTSNSSTEALREQIMARISPRATMMSRSLPVLPEVPVWNEPLAHQIRRVHSTHLAELRRQWEEQQQQQRREQNQSQGQEQQQRPQLQQRQRYNSYPPIQSVPTSQYAPVAMSRTPTIMPHQFPPPSTSAVAASEGLLQMPEDENEVYMRTRAQGANSLYVDYEGGVLQPEERWRRGHDDM
ncbi:hypothetical protein BGX29_006803 [Mortierella sp. GBA35]|nr:hypothetical protein BGX29_006803 [Mortierella sp. GBA35]